MTNKATLSIDEKAVQEFRTRLRGELISAGDETYDDVRQVWNGMIDKRPALIARCSGAEVWIHRQPAQDPGGGG